MSRETTIANITGTDAASASPGLRSLLRTMQRRSERAGWTITAGEWNGAALVLELKRGPLCEPDRWLRISGTPQRATLERFDLESRTERMGRRGDIYMARVRVVTFLGRTAGPLPELLRDAAAYITDNRSPLQLETRAVQAATERPS